MALDTFPAISPDYSSSPCQVEARVLKSDFGDGYVQKAGDGINSIRRTWPLTWSNITNAEAKTITDFLEAKGGYTPFYWTPPRTTTPLKWTCAAWTSFPNDANRMDVTATFIQDFSL